MKLVDRLAGGPPPRIMSDAVADPLILFDGKSGKAIDVNRALCRRLGCTRKKALALSFGGMSSCAPGFMEEDAGRWIRRTIEDGEQRFEWQCRTVSGQPFWTEVILRRVAMQRRRNVLAQLHDISRLTQSEESLRLGRIFQRELVDNAPFGAGVVRVEDQRYKFDFVSSPFCVITGLSSEALLQDPQNLIAIFPEKEREDLRQTIEKAIRSRTRFQWEGSARVRSENRWLQIESYPAGPTGSVTFWSCIIFDITEQRQTKEALERRIVALTTPLTDASTIAFEDMFNLTDIQDIQDRFAQATGVASVITLPDGTPITMPSSFCRLCSDIVRKSEKGRSNCRYSDTVLGRFHPEGPLVQPCLSAGLWDAGASIAVGGHHVATWLIGQIRDETQTEETLLEYARAIGVDETEFVGAFREVPKMSREHFNEIANALFALAKLLSTTAYQNIQQARFIAERKQAEEALRASERKYRQIVEAANESIITWNNDFIITFVSAQVSSMLGYQQDELVGTPAASLLFQEDRPSHDVVMAHLMEGKPLRIEEHKLLHKDGHAVWCLSSLTPTVNAEGLVVGCVALVTDISKRKIAEERYRSIVQSLMDGFELIDLGGRILDINETYCRMVGYDRTELLTMNVSDLDGTLSPEEVSAKLVATQQTGYSRFETTHKRRNGEDIHLDLSAQVLPGSPYIYVFLRDISERKRTDDKLQAMARLQETILDTVSTGLSYVKNSTQHWANKAFGTMFGYAPEEVCNVSSSLFFPDKEEGYTRLASEGYSTLAQGKVFSTETHMRKKDGTIRLCTIDAKALDPSNISQGAICVVQDVTERREAEEALRRSEELLRESQRAANIGSWEMNLSTRRLYWNEESYRLHGIPDDGTVIDLEKFLGLIVPEDRIIATNHFSYTMKTRVFLPFEVRIIRGDGRERTILVTGSIKYDKEGNPCSQLGIVQDITERKLAEERFKTLIQTSMDWFILHNNTGLILDVNNALCRATGRAREELIGGTILQFMNHESVADYMKLLPDIVRKGSMRIENRSRHNDGSSLYLELSVTHMRREEDLFFLFLRDITAQKTAQKELAESQERLHAFMDSATDACTIWDENLILTDLNQSALGFLPGGKSREDLIGPGRSTPFPASWGETARLQCRNVIETGVPIAQEQCVSYEGKPTWLYTRMFRVGRGIGIMSADITDRKVAEEEIRCMNEELEQRIAERTQELQKSNKELESFTYTISHDLRSPLRAIDGFTKILLEDHGFMLDAEGKRLCSVVCDETRRMGTLVDDLLAFTRLGRTALRRSSFDMSAMAETVFQELISADDRARINFTAIAMPPAYGDVRLIRQVMVNLISNAVKFTATRDRPQIEVGSIIRNDTPVYYVRDNGVGFDMQYASKLFGVFHRLHTEREFEGTGVGLAIAQRIINRHGGQIRAEGEVDNGATFFFTLPQKGETS